MKNFYEEFKSPIVTVIAIFIAFFVYTKLAGPIPFFINSVTTTKTDLFSASGEGKVTAVPDTATISVGVTKDAQTVSLAQNQVNTIANKLIADLKKLGLTDNDIKTTDYSVNPNSLPNGQASGYEVTQNIDVNIKPIENVNKAIDTATLDGANIIGGVNFTFSDDLQKSLEQKATQIAVGNAKENAINLANAAGVKLGNIVNVVSNTTNPGPMPLSANIKSNAVLSAPTTVTPGQNTIDIGVTLYYETY